MNFVNAITKLLGDLTGNSLVSVDDMKIDIFPLQNKFEKVGLINANDISIQFFIQNLSNIETRRSDFLEQKSESNNVARDSNKIVKRSLAKRDAQEKITALPYFSVERTYVFSEASPHPIKSLPIGNWSASEIVVRRIC